MGDQMNHLYNLCSIKNISFYFIYCAWFGYSKQFNVILATYKLKESYCESLESNFCIKFTCLFIP